VILQDLVGYLGRRYAYADLTTAIPITVLCDEFGDVAFPLFTNALNKGGGAQARFILAQQSLADAEAAMGAAQARRVFDNLRAVCRAAGGDFDRVVRVTVYLTDLANFAKVNEVMSQNFKEPYPARAAVGVASLPRGSQVEVDAVMFMGEK